MKIIATILGLAVLTGCATKVDNDGRCMHGSAHGGESRGGDSGSVPVNVHGERLSLLDKKFPDGILRGVLTLSQTPFEVPRAICVAMTSGEEDISPVVKLIVLPLSGSLLSAMFCTARALAGGFDILTFGVNGEAFYGNLIAPLVWEEQWVGGVKSTEQCIKDAEEKRRENKAEKTVPPPVEVARDEWVCGRWQVVQSVVDRKKFHATGKSAETLKIMKTEYDFRNDGTFSALEKYSGLESLKKGTWDYSRDRLTLRFDKIGSGETVYDLNVNWTSAKEFSVRHDNVERFAEAFGSSRSLVSSDSARSSKASYDGDGRLRHVMEYGDRKEERVYDPWIFTRLED